MLLSIKNLVVHYGKSVALNDVSIDMSEGSIVGLIGANGSGKSTLLKALSGLKPLTSGEIWFKDQRIDGKLVSEIVKLGIVQVPEGRKLFPFLSVMSNLELGASLRKDKNEINEDLAALFKRFPILWEKRNQQAVSLSGGQQQLLAIARGLMAKPALLLLDEPSLGLAPLMIDELAHIIAEINQKGVSVILVEQNVPLAMRAIQNGYALQTGKVVFEGDIEKFRSSTAIKRAYLGA